MQCLLWIPIQNDDKCNKPRVSAAFPPQRDPLPAAAGHLPTAAGHAPPPLGPGSDGMAKNTGHLALWGVIPVLSQ